MLSAKLSENVGINKKRGIFKLMISAVIAAAGLGLRMDANLNKLYMKIGNMPILAISIKAFQNCDSIDEIVVVVRKEDINYCENEIVKKYGYNKVKKIIEGGKSRQKSVYNGLKELNCDCGIVLIHDGARPFITDRIILENINTAKNFNAACTAVPVKDTVKKSNKDNFVIETLERQNLWAVQTPQTFMFCTILDAHEIAIKDGFEGTDDAILVERMDMPVKLVMGDYNNIKITTPEDLIIAEKIMQKRL